MQGCEVKRARVNLGLLLQTVYLFSCFFCAYPTHPTNLGIPNNKDGVKVQQSGHSRQHLSMCNLLTPYILNRAQHLFPLEIVMVRMKCSAGLALVDIFMILQIKIYFRPTIF